MAKQSSLFKISHMKQKFRPVDSAQYLGRSIKVFKSSRQRLFVPNVTVIHPVVFETFHFLSQPLGTKNVFFKIS